MCDGDGLSVYDAAGGCCRASSWGNCSGIAQTSAMKEKGHHPSIHPSIHVSIYPSIYLSLPLPSPPH
jgi:hypothetical protein